jgi:putative nucleotidyltransferase with HDIG domain
MDISAERFSAGCVGKELHLAEIVSALSYALDLTDGQPAGHSVRCCWIGMHLGKAIGLSAAELHDLYYVLLLKDLGCSSNAARICELFVTNDHDFKRNVKLVDNSLAQVLRFIAENTAVKSGLAEKLRTVLRLAASGGKIDRELIETRCQRGADIARQMRFSEGVARGILDLDEHWDGRGHPMGLTGKDIALPARIALLAQVVDVFNVTGGRESAMQEIQFRSGRWFDPELVTAFETVATDLSFWSVLSDPQLDKMVFELEPAGFAQAVDDELLDDIADGFAQVVDAKSPYTSGHSKRVALVTELIATELGFAADRKRWLVRAALLHDIGKLGVSNEVLDKPGKLDADEWAAMKRHPTMGAAILSRIEVFKSLSLIARDHHEKLDGSGYPQGLSGEQIDLETRIVTVADIFDALTADRPYRAAMPTASALAIMNKDVGTALDGDCVAALTRALERLALQAA